MSRLGAGPASTSFHSRNAVWEMISLTRVGSSTPGSWMRMRSLSIPWRWITGSETPNWSTRLRIVSSAWRTARSRMFLSMFGLKANAQVSEPASTLYSGR